tara:strand:- start:2563 stop:3306 length:744 start_codon:yes stop_codon:yes gene_type:complete
MNKLVEYISKKGTHVEGALFLHGVPVKVTVDPPTVSLGPAVKRIAALMPPVFFKGLKKIVITNLMSHNEDKPFNAFYSDNIIYVSYKLESEKDFIDDVVHELAHHIEKYFYEFIYGDESIREEFIKKREKLFYALKGYGMQPPDALKTSVKYHPEIDDYLYRQIGYEKLFNFTNGIFLTPYAATSLKEYFAISFEKYFLRKTYETHMHIKKITPIVYNKILELKENTNETQKKTRSKNTKKRSRLAR